MLYLIRLPPATVAPAGPSLAGHLQHVEELLPLFGFLLSFPHAGVDVIWQELGVITLFNHLAFFSTRISSALITVDRRWAIITVVRFDETSAKEARDLFCGASRADVASSKMRISGDFRCSRDGDPLFFLRTVLIPVKCCSLREAPPQSWIPASRAVFSISVGGRPSDHRKCYKRQYR